MRLAVHDSTPAELNSGGSGMQVQWGVTESPFGKCFLAKTTRGISHLSFFDHGETESLEMLTNDWPRAIFTRDDILAASTIELIFRDDSPLHLHLRGTEFQIKVWKALIEIPHGGLSTYGELAERIGKAGSARAVGNAVGQNRISYLIPCHRVIRASGEIGGYRWGVERKRALLSWEQEKPLTLR